MAGLEKDGNMKIPEIVVFIVSVLERIISAIAALIAIYIAIKNKRNKPPTL